MIYLDHNDNCRAAVSTYTENSLEEGIQPTWEQFRTEYPEFDHEAYIDLYEAEMKRVTILWEAAKVREAV